MKTQSVIIGGGLAGLACASKMQKEKHEFFVIEQSDRLGVGLVLFMRVDLFLI